MNETIKRIITGAIAGAVFFGAYLYSPILFSILLSAIILYIAIAEWPQLCKTKLMYAISLPLYPMLPGACLFYLLYKYYSVSIVIPLFPFLVAWTYDTCAYAVGMLIGKHKMCPSISPGKSWEGLLGGYFGVHMLNSFLYHMYPITVTTIFTSRNIAVLLTVLLTTVAFFGDISISYLKRKAAIKDTGSILPGHGGLLDRFDSVFLVAVFVTAWILIF